MAIFLDEDFFGQDEETIGFPHLLLCMGFVAIVKTGYDERTMWGIHLTGTEASQRTFGIFAPRMLEEVDPNNIECIYGSCNRLIRYGSTDEGLWKSEMKSFARMLGFKGEAMGFDTSVIKPRDGTYVQYDLDPFRGRCRIFYRQNDRMEFSKEDAPLGQKVIFGSNIDVSMLPERVRAQALAKTRDRIEEVSYSTSGIAKIIKGRGLFATGALREVDYSLRLSRVYVA